MYLEKINSPEDLKKLNKDVFPALSSEIRQALLTKLSEHGGHIGPNLGAVELTIALHYVFNSPVDKFVYDVSHQSYIHKMLTGRREAFTDPAKYDDVSGYTNPKESAHDFFTIGHTSTSVSLASGMAKARDLKGDKENIIAIIGDGSLSGGEAYEGLNNVVEMGTNFIVIVNDNDQSIAENHGGLYGNLRKLRETNGEAPDNFFKALGFDYRYVAEGNNTDVLIEVLESVKDIDHPVLLHIHTIKGKGYAPAEKDRETWHYGMPFDMETGKPKVTYDEPDYGSLTGQYLLNKMKEDRRIVAITSGTPTVLGFTPEMREKAGKQFFDVGIAEEQAVAMSSGIAKNEAIPVYGVFSTFLQRTYDQLVQDLCLNNNPAVILIQMASVYGMNDESHLGFFDLGMLGNIPNLVYLAPATKEEYFAMLDWSITQREHPVAIRMPIQVVETGEKDTTDYSELNKYKVTKQGKEVAVIALGSFYQLGEQVTAKLAADLNISATLINPKFANGIDTDLLEGLKKDHQLVLTLEDGVLDGGFGEKIASFYGPSDMKVKNYGIRKEFHDRYVADELLAENGVTPDQITADVKAILQLNR